MRFTAETLRRGERRGEEESEGFGIGISVSSRGVRFAWLDRGGSGDSETALRDSEGYSWTRGHRRDAETRRKAQRERRL